LIIDRKVKQNININRKLKDSHKSRRNLFAFLTPDVD
jgi:hypothetical protein